MFKALRESIVQGNVPKTQKIIQDHMLKRVPTKTVIEEGIIPAIEAVGKKFLTDDFFITDVLLAGRAANGALRAIEKQERIQGHFTQRRTRIVIGTVSGDIHNIGKNTLCLLLDASSFEVIDLGVDVSKEKFVKAIKKYKPNVVMLSALLMTTMQEMREVVKAVREDKEIDAT
ncbi:MAG: cobalamin B12-binding domain-containing protein, partial [Eubacteriaceae bacterium]